MLKALTPGDQVTPAPPLIMDHDADENDLVKVDFATSQLNRRIACLFFHIRSA